MKFEVKCLVTVFLLIILSYAQGTSGTRDTLIEQAQFHALTVNGQMVVVEGLSMVPRLLPGDVVVVAPVPFEELVPGHLIQFHAPPVLVARRRSKPTWIHQVVVRGKDWIQTWGIGNAEQDPFVVEEEDYVGRVIAIYVRP